MNTEFTEQLQRFSMHLSLNDIWTHHVNKGKFLFTVHIECGVRTLKSELNWKYQATAVNSQVEGY